VSLTGAECFAPGLAPFIGPPGDLLPFTISETANTVAADMPLMVPLLFGGPTCAFVGTRAGGALTLTGAANCAAASPQPCRVFSRVVGDTRSRTIKFIAATFTASATAYTLGATLLETWSLFDTDTQTSVGQMAVASRWSLVHP